MLDKVFDLWDVLLQLTSMFLILRYIFFERPLEARKQKIYYIVSYIVVVWTILILISWLALFLSYYPGGVMSDTQATISYYYDGVLTNRFPFFYNLIVGIFINLSELMGRGLYQAVAALTILQMLFAIHLTDTACTALAKLCFPRFQLLRM